jgi:N-acetylmuramoyl-L-alanine amidase
MLLALVLLSSAVGSPEEKQISVYSNIANYSLPVSEENGRDYVGIFEVVEPLGKVSEKTDGDRWVLRYNDVECDFKQGDETARVAGENIHLGLSFVLRNGRGLVAVHALSQLLPKLLGGPVNLNEAARRLYIGNAGVHFTAQMRTSLPAALAMDFTSSVNPAISTEPGKLTLVFAHEPLMPPGTPSLTFASKDITSAVFSEGNGTAEIAVTGTVPLFASFSNNGRTITIQPAPQQQPAAKVAIGNKGAADIGAQAGLSASGVPPRYFAVIDAAHGGTESGAMLGSQLAEKDITLAIARRLRDELEVRGVTTMLLRNTDATLATDDRASVANQQHEAIYICVHASSQGQGVRLYTALIPAGDINRGPFLGWQTAQAPFLSSSQNAAAMLSTELQKSHIQVRQLMAPLRPLNSIVSAAIAVEVAPPSADPTSLTSPAYQQFVASSLASGIAALRNGPGGAQ